MELASRSEEHTSELQSLRHLVCRLLLEKKIHEERPSNRESTGLRVAWVRSGAEGGRQARGSAVTGRERSTGTFRAEYLLFFFFSPPGAPGLLPFPPPPRSTV